jgi:hypothetical protein
MSGGPPPGVNATFVGTDDTLVSKGRWNQLAGMQAVVGQCRACGGDMEALAPSEHDAQGEAEQITWYEARCRACGKEVAAPNGRIFRRSSAHLETPRAWLETRASRDAEERKQIQQSH